MKRNRVIWVTAAALALAAGVTPAWAQQISEARIRDLIKQAAERVARDPSLVRGQTSPAAPTGGIL